MMSFNGQSVELDPFNGDAFITDVDGNVTRANPFVSSAAWLELEAARLAYSEGRVEPERFAEYSMNFNQQVVGAAQYLADTNNIQLSQAMELLNANRRIFKLSLRKETPCSKK